MREPGPKIEDKFSVAQPAHNRRRSRPEAVGQFGVTKTAGFELHHVSLHRLIRQGPTPDEGHIFTHHDGAQSLHFAQTPGHGFGPDQAMKTYVVELEARGLSDAE